MYISNKIASGILTFMMIVMVSLAVMPHHHHTGEVCFAESHCAGEDLHHGPADCPDATDHKHDMPGNGAGCSVMQSYLPPEMKNFGFQKGKANNWQDLPISCLEGTDGTLVLTNRSEKLQPGPEHRPCACHRAGSTSLRAPPLA